VKFNQINKFLAVHKQLLLERRMLLERIQEIDRASEYLEQQLKGKVGAVESTAAGFAPRPGLEAVWEFSVPGANA
jgi:hypothetical protein